MNGILREQLRGFAPYFHLDGSLLLGLIIFATVNNLLEPNSPCTESAAGATCWIYARCDHVAQREVGGYCAECLPKYKYPNREYANPSRWSEWHLEDAKRGSYDQQKAGFVSAV